MVARKLGFFYPPRGAAARNGARGGKTASWGRVYDTLIRAGYGRTPADIGRLTARQIMLFFRESMRREARMRAARIVDMNAATQAKDGGKALLKSLNAED